MPGGGAQSSPTGGSSFHYMAVQDDNYDHDRRRGDKDNRTTSMNSKNRERGREGEVRHNPEAQHAQRDVNMEAAYLHVLTDLIQSAGVFLSGIVVWLDNDLRIVDPIVTLVFAIVILFSTFSVLSKIFGVLFQGMPDNIDYDDV